MRSVILSDESVRSEWYDRI